MKKRIAALISAVFVLGASGGFWATSAISQVAPCFSHSDIVAFLIERHGEKIIFTGVRDDGMVLEVFGNGNQNSWTMIMVGPTGVACGLAVGSDFTVTLENIGRGI